MEGIRNVKEYWESLHPKEREVLLNDLYFSLELATMDYNKLPSHIRLTMYSRWNFKWRYQKHEFQP